LLATLGPLAGVALLLGFGFVFREPLQRVLVAFTESIDSMGAEGYVVYMLLYVVLEVLAIPAIPLTMTGGLLFGAIAGTAVVSICATAAATIAYLIARYVARDRVRKLVQGNKKFEAIDRAIGKDGFRVVTLLRLSPLLPLALSNYLYGLTSVPLRPYIAGTCIGMLLEQQRTSQPDRSAARSSLAVRVAAARCRARGRKRVWVLVLLSQLFRRRMLQGRRVISYRRLSRRRKSRMRQRPRWTRKRERQV
jgi:uncharacterized membrane protein YdjX (TVP38/TMEM64 family)